MPMTKSPLQLNGKVLIITAPSGAGKTTIYKHLLSVRNDLSLSVSATSRAKREHEEHGREYYFLSKEAFEQKIQNDEFVEYEEFAGNMYGTLKSEVQRIWDENKKVLFETEPIGAVNLKKAYGENALLLFIKTPTFEVIEQRLRSRGTETEEAIQKRLKTAKYDWEYQNNESVDTIIMNDDLEVCVKEVEEIVEDFFSEK